MKKLFSLFLITILFFSSTLSSNALENLSKIRDVNDTISQESLDYPYYDAIKWGYEMWIFNWYTSWKDKDKFGPNNTINRAEFLSMMFKTLKISVWTEYDKSCFKDSKAGLWYNKYLCYSKNNKFITWYSDWSFKPNNNILVSEAIKILVNSFRITNNTTSFYSKYGISSSRNDGKWYYEKSSMMLQNWIRTNDKYNYSDSYEKSLTRWEMVNLLYQFYAVSISQKTTTDFLNNFKNKNWTEMFKLLDKNSTDLEVDSSRYSRIISSIPVYIESIKYKGWLFYNGDTHA